MTKIYKTIRAHELEQHTRDGWTWDAQPPLAESQIVRDPTNPPYYYYNGRDNGPVKSETFFGNVLIFVVWKELAVIDQEHNHAERVRLLSDQIYGQSEEIKKLKEESAKQEQLVIAAEKRFEHQREILERAGMRATKLERDVAKIRMAIGDLKMQEILK